MDGLATLHGTVWTRSAAALIEAAKDALNSQLIQ